MVRKIAYSLLVLALAFGAAGCKKQQYTYTYTQKQKEEAINTTPVNLRRIDDETRAAIAGKTVAVVLAHGYNDDESVAAITQMLDENYGVQAEYADGLVDVLVFPQDFKNERISLLAEKLEDKDLCGIIVVGAPEGTHKALAKIIDRTEEAHADGGDGTDAAESPFVLPVFSFLSQDDILGTESTSSFVLDYAHTALDGTDTSAELEESAPTAPAAFDMTAFINNAVLAMITLRAPLAPDSSLLPFVRGMLGGDFKISRYVDTETGIQSLNHFVFE